LKLAINATSLAPGGGMTGLVGFLTAWRELDLDLEITVYGSRRQVLQAAEESFPGIRIIPFAEGMSSMKHFYLQQTKLGTILEAEKYSVVMTTQTAVGRCDIPQLVHHTNLKRYTHTVSQRIMKRQFSELTKDMAARQALKTCAAHAYISDFLRREAEKFVPESAPRNHVVYNGLAERIIAAAQVDTDGWSGRPQVCAVQNSEQHKDNPTLLRAFAQLVETEPKVDWRLEIAGGGNWGVYKQEAQHLGIGDRVEFLGFIGPDQLDTLLRSSCCLMFTSVLEGFGIPPLEAMARRCPVIACDCTALPEVVGDAGVLVPPGDAAAFAAHASRLYHEEDYRQPFIQRGLQRIGKFRWTDSAMAMYRLFEQIAR